MTGEVRPFIVAQLEKKCRLSKDFDDETDFIDAGIVDSIGLIKFVLALESHFAIDISESDIESPDFRTVRGLVDLIGRKKLG